MLVAGRQTGMKQGSGIRGRGLRSGFGERQNLQAGQIFNSLFTYRNFIQVISLVCFATLCISIGVPLPLASASSFREKAPNFAPIAKSTEVLAYASVPKAISLSASDAEGSALQFELLTFPTSGTLSGTVPNVQYTANPGFSGTDSFSFKVNDGQRDSARAFVTLYVIKDPFSANAGLDSDRDGTQDVQVSHDETFLTIRSQGFPNHPTATFPNSKNPNSIRKQNHQFKIPLNPRKNDRVTGLPMGPIGVALNGIPFFNPFNAEGQVAVDGYSEEWLDACCGHPDMRGTYHYHKYPTCLRTPFKENGDQHSPLIGFAFDGFGIYGPFESNGLMARDVTGSQALDECNGHTDQVRGYHYHVTPNKFPFIIGAYRGVPEVSNNPMIRVGQGAALQGSVVGASPYDSMVASVKPASAQAGTTQTITVEVANVGVPTTAPTKVWFGPYAGSNIKRTGSLVTAEVSLSADIAPGVHDVHLEFAGQGTTPTVIRKKNAFTVVSDTAQAEIPFTLEFEAPAATVVRGKVIDTVLHIKRNEGFMEVVTISISDDPLNRIRISPSTLTSNGCCLPVSISTRGIGPTGTFTVNVSGKDSSGRVRTATLELIVKGE